MADGIANFFLVVTDVTATGLELLRCYNGRCFCYTPDEARSVGLAKDCGLSKSLFCYREISFHITFPHVPPC